MAVILHTFEKVKLRSAKIFVTETRNLKIKIPLVYQVKAKQDYCSLEKKQWQAEVLKAKPWDTMTFDKIEEQIKKFSYIKDASVSQFISRLEN